MPTIDYRIDPNAAIRHGDATVAGGGAGNVPTYARPDVLDDSSSDASVADSRYRAEPWESPPLPLTTADTNLASGADAVLYWAAPGPNKHHVFYGFGYGYSGTPTNGGFGIQSPSGTYVFGPVQVTAGGPGSFDFSEGIRMPANQDVRVVLLSGGAAVGGRVSLKGRAVE